MRAHNKVMCQEAFFSPAGAAVARASFLIPTSPPPGLRVYVCVCECLGLGVKPKGRGCTLSLLVSSSLYLRGR